MKLPSPSVLAAVLGVLACGCVTTETRRPAVSADNEVRLATPGRSWEVRSAQEVIGLVVFFEAHGAPEDSTYMVRNVWHQDLGHIDAHGRAYRYLPHHKEPAWIGTGTVKNGVERILNAASCELLEVQFPGFGAARPRESSATADRMKKGTS